jgi:hypothetical protein
MAYLTFNNLTQRVFSKATILNESVKKNEYSDIKVFLSYRREDKVWVDPVVRFLKRIGISVYIDYLDETLDDRETANVAQTLREAINGCKKFICLATPNARKSKWMPWELGLGDRIVNYKNVAVLPLTNLPDSWGDQEYGAIYGRIENFPSYGFSSDDTWYVVYPDGQKIKLKTWFLN